MGKELFKKKPAFLGFSGASGFLGGRPIGASRMRSRVSEGIGPTEQGFNTCPAYSQVILLTGEFMGKITDDGLKKCLNPYYRKNHEGAK
jgi:hypothetical protein